MADLTDLMRREAGFGDGLRAHPRVTDQMSDWDVVNYLAEAEGLVPSVKGKTLTLHADDEALPVLRVEYEEPTPESHADGTFIALSGVRNLDRAGDATVTVHSWDHKAKKAVKAEKTSKGAGGPALIYEYRVPGAKQDRAARIAQKRLVRATGQERGITVEVPGDPGIMARMRTELVGTSTTFDQTYENESAEHRINPEEGYRTHVTAKGPSKGRDGGKGGGGASGSKAGSGAGAKGGTGGVTGRNADAGPGGGHIVA